MLLKTNYSFFDLGDRAGKPGPEREVSVIAHDGDKYAIVEYNGKRLEAKVGYLYSEEADGEVLYFYPSLLSQYGVPEVCLESYYAILSGVLSLGQRKPTKQRRTARRCPSGKRGRKCMP